MKFLVLNILIYIVYICFEEIEVFLNIIKENEINITYIAINSILSIFISYFILNNLKKIGILE